MSFVNPTFLYALIALSIPIIIHLFNFRRFRKVYFTNVRFLKEVKQETQSRSRLKHLLVLLMRMLAVASLVVAFAQPFVPVDDQDQKGGSRVVSVYIDNSFSMDAVSENGRLLDLAKNFALEIAENYQSTDRFQLLTNKFEGRHQRLVNRDEFIELVDEVEVSPAVRTTSEVILRQRDAITNAEEALRSAYLISDFQKSITSFDGIETDSTIAVNLIPLQAEATNNIYIDSVWFTTPVRQVNQADKAVVRVRNTGSTDYENVPLKLLINGQQKALTSFSIAANSYIDTALFFTATETGIQQASAEIRDYPITYDDRYFFSYDVAVNLPVLCINGADSNVFVQKLLGTDPYFELQQVNVATIDYGTIGSKKLIILSELDEISSGLTQELSRFVSDGGHLLVFPSSNIDLDSYTELLLTFQANTFTALDTNATKVAQINELHPVFQDVFERIPDNMDLPVVTRHYGQTSRINTNQEAILKLQSGVPYLCSYNWARGRVYVAASDFSEESGNFARHALFVPILYNIAINSNPTPRIAHTLGLDEPIEVPAVAKGAESVYHISASNSDFDIVQEPRIVNNRAMLQLGNVIQEAGNYVVRTAESDIAGLAFNYDRKESDLKALDMDALRSAFEAHGLSNFALLDASAPSFASTLSELREGKKYWKHFIVLCLAFLAMEIILLRIWKS